VMYILRITACLALYEDMWLALRSSSLYNPIVVLIDLIIDRPKLDQTKSDTGVGVSPRVMFCLGSCPSAAVTALGSVQAEPCVAISGG
jgi:hypothetical protein